MITNNIEMFLSVFKIKRTPIRKIVVYDNPKEGEPENRERKLSSQT